MLVSLLFIVLAYLAGSCSFAIITCKLLHLPDPRTQGSGNAGATNISRIAGKKVALFVAIADILKAIIPILLARYCGVSGVYLSFVAVFAFLGHIYPIFFGFRGGKGVATAMGSFIALCWPLGCALALIWLITALIWRYSSLSSIVLAIFAPILAIWLAPPAYHAGIILMSLMILWKHSANIKRLLDGTETKMGKK